MCLDKSHQTLSIANIETTTSQDMKHCPISPTQESTPTNLESTFDHDEVMQDCGPTQESTIDHQIKNSSLIEVSSPSQDASKQSQEPTSRQNPSSPITEASVVFADCVPKRGNQKKLLSRLQDDLKGYYIPKSSKRRTNDNN